jgi:MFS transporter, PAT family, beta-lactamase induction signal transducer AmpG
MPDQSSPPETPEVAQAPAQVAELSVEPRSPWSFVPILYFLQGLPVMIVQGTAGAMYTKLGVVESTMGLWVSLLKLPWMLKPLWGPVVELNFTKRKWIVWMQALMVLALIASAYAITQSAFFTLSVAAFFVVAFLSATHDIAADGFYLLSLKKSSQAFFVGIRSAAFRLGALMATFGLVYIAGDLEEKTGNIPRSWFVALMVGAVLYGLFALVNAFAMPKPVTDVPGRQLAAGDRAPFLHAFAAFFRQDRIFWVLMFILFFRFGESMIATMAPPFLLKEPEVGGMGISTKAQGTLGGAVGVISLTVGGILGGWMISKYGIRKTIWPMVLSLNIPNLAYIWVAATRPESRITQALAGAPEDLVLFSGEWWAHSGNVLLAAVSDPLGTVIAIDQFGYGFGLSAYLVYLMYVSQGSKYKAASYAIATGLMALGALLAGTISGYLVDYVRQFDPANTYLNFFIVVMFFTIPGMITLFFIPKHYEDTKETVQID